MIFASILDANWMVAKESDCGELKERLQWHIDINEVG
jgi:hypothetical protein